MAVLPSSSGGRLQTARVLVTRPKERTAELCFLLEDEGAEVVSLPLLELVPPDDPRPLAAAAEQIHRYAWIAFASPSGVQALMEAVREAGTEKNLGPAKIAVVGPRTARAAREAQLEVTVEAAQASGGGLVEALQPLLELGTEVLLPSAQNARPELMEGLLAMGMQVTRVAAYQSSPLTTHAGTWQALKLRPPQLVIFGSPRTVDAFFDLTAEQGLLSQRLQAVAIGPTTARALEAHGQVPAAVASAPTASGLVEAAVQAWESLT